MWVSRLLGNAARQRMAVGCRALGGALHPLFLHVVLYLIIKLFYYGPVHQYA